MNTREELVQSALFLRTSRLIREADFVYILFLGVWLFLHFQMVDLALPDNVFAVIDTRSRVLYQIIEQNIVVKWVNYSIVLAII